MSAYERMVRPLLFRLEAERAHGLTIAACRVLGAVPPARGLAGRMYAARTPGLEVEALGRAFPNPLGLAAGFDKNGHAAPLLRSMGLGHVEIGSVSMSPSEGNPRPRLFRLIDDDGVAVWYGVPNEGSVAVASTLARQGRAGSALGINLVRTNAPSDHETDAASVYEDYATSFRRLQPWADYIALNLSCPNTDEQDFFDDPEHLDGLLSRIEAERPAVPIVLKLRPTLDSGALRRAIEVADRHPTVSGFAINLPSHRPDGLALHDRERVAALRGAIAGRPIRDYVDDVLILLARQLPAHSRYTVTAAGGVSNGEDAYRKIRRGASLVQLYTSLIYRGPRVVSAVSDELRRLLDRDRFETVAAAIGVDARR